MEDSLKNKINGLPQKPGVYFFKDAGERVLYVGKAKNLKKRVKNHFQKPDQHMFDFIAQVSDIDFIKTSSEKEALILEQQFIKRLQPRWNVEWKDDKNYFFVALTDENFPRAYLTHQPNAHPAMLRALQNKCNALSIAKNTDYYGPFVSGREVKGFLRETRKILPYRSCRNLPKRPCFYQSLGLCAALCANKRLKSKYQRTVKTLKVLLEIYQGRADSRFCRDNIPAEKLQGYYPCKLLRIEGYDVSNLSGTLAVGSMVVFENGKPNKNGYRKFRIKRIKGQNDVASLREVLLRRLKHVEWPLPDLLLLDGGKGQLKAARGIDIPALALAKTKQGRLFSPFSKSYVPLERLPQNLRNILLQVRDESHRFAINYNKKCREKTLK